MPKTQKRPNPRLYCPRCHNETRHNVEATADADETWYGTDGKELSMGVTLILATCDGCSTPAVYRHTDDDAPDEATLAYPEIRTFDESVPPKIQKIWRDAQVLQQHAPGLFAVQVGRALEIICRDRGAKGRTLDLQLKDLTQRGELPGSIGRMAEKLRILRNLGAHAADVEVSVPDAWILAEFFEAIVMYLYVWPAKVKHLQERIEKRKRATA